MLANTQLMLENSKSSDEMFRLRTLEKLYIREAPRVRSRMGIVMMWTSKTWRRKGLATRLLDFARSHLYRGYVVPKEELALLQVNTDCAGFISRYIGTTDVLMYDKMNKSRQKISSTTL